MGLTLSSKLSLRLGRGAADLYPSAKMYLDFANVRYRASPTSPVIRDPTAFPGWSYSRTGAGFAEDLSGLLVPFASGVYRRTNKGLLVEPASTNLALRSQEWATSPWGTTGATVSADVTSAPDGSMTADKIIEGAASGNHNASQSVTVGNVPVTYSVYVKAAERTKVQVSMSDLTTGDAGTNVDLSTGTLSSTGLAVGSWTAVSQAIQSLGNGCFRVTVTATKGAGTQVAFRVGLLNASGSLSYTGDGASGAFGWGAQLEQAGFATSCIPTTTAAATRAADAVAFTIPSGVTTLTYTFDDDSTQAVAVAAGTYNVPTNLNRPYIKRIIGA